MTVLQKNRTNPIYVQRKSHHKKLAHTVGHKEMFRSSHVAQWVKVQRCHCTGSDQCCGAGLIPCLGTSACGQKKKKKEEDVYTFVHWSTDIRFLKII